MLKKLTINQLLFFSHLMLVVILIAGLSYSRYQSEWESRVNNEAALMEQSMSPLMREISAAVAGRNYTALTMPSHKDTLASIDSLLFLDIEGTSDYQGNKVCVRYFKETGEIWRIDVSDEELDIARQSRDALNSKLQSDELDHVAARKLTFLLNKAEKDLVNLTKSQTLTNEFKTPWPIERLTQKFVLFPDYKIAAIQLPLFNKNGGFIYAVFDASHLYSLKSDIYLTIAIEAVIALFVSLLLIVGVTHWLVAPLRRLAAEMDKDIERLNIAALDEIKRTDEIGVLARGLHTLTRKTQSQLKLLKHMSDTDALTGLSGRHNYNERAVALFNTTRHQGASFGVIVCDIDHFKLYNDSFGHGKGDDVIKKIADVLISTTRTNDLSFRIGGEEFVVLLKVHEAENLLFIAERMRSEVEALAIPHTTETGVVTLSVGAALVPPDSRQLTYTDAFEFADKLLYSAKNAGRNRVEFKEMESGQQPSSHQPHAEMAPEAAK
ncbi:sensor domain-containing diguanylate cyclase [Enterovibrio sp. ZSDZ35]|uniref:diguanylate cyclase n=1 Tax=Enterovibrio qingdaonensis TaxID=2899818 RepID=A0ABT5QQH5_9GAMM|nr:sensor domain-containing diguanylate cyclase [Enterovibrio sp. ZSDZ35]MDD1783139.1 sensor domain-containing diguanylate cyclase [Enterovibrio sp. ZSDZ35]